MNVTVFGVGYVGLVQAAVLADVGHQVICIDVDLNKIRNLEKGVIPIYEAGLAALVEENFKGGRLKFSTDAETGVAHGKVQFIAVGTPADEDGSADLQYVLAVAETIATYMDDIKVIVNKSTVPVGTSDKVNVSIAKILQKRNQALDYHVVSNPEFLKEGDAVQDCQYPDRIIIGSDNSHAIDIMKELYAPFNRDHNKVIEMSVKSAELTKYAANCMLATKVSFINEMANLAEILGADIEDVRIGIGSDSRIGYHFINPGCGYGGSCFPKDVQALINTADSIGYDAKILKSVETVNAKQKEKLFYKISKHYNGNLAGRVFALWGLSFKPNTDDMREASSRVLMEALWRAGAKIQAYDPGAKNECQRIYGERSDLSLRDSQELVLKGADALIIVTEWQHFKSPDFDLIKTELTAPVIFDGRNQYDVSRLRHAGFIYYSIGRK